MSYAEREVTQPPRLKVRCGLTSGEMLLSTSPRKEIVNFRSGRLTKSEKKRDKLKLKLIEAH